MTQQHDGSRAALKADPAAQAPRKMEKGWHERHVRWQAEGRIPAGRTQLRYEDGTFAFDSRGYPRMWSEHVAVAMQPSQRSSRSIARERARAEEASRQAARQAEAARAAQAHVQPGLRSPPGRLFATDLAGLMLRGPAGGIGAGERLVRTLMPLSEGGRHPSASLQVAGGWPDEASMREALAAVGGKLGAIGLRIDRRREGIKMAKARVAP